jgi:flagellum-specific peptidoglycan hydrolase FlgJ
MTAQELFISKYYPFALQLQNTKGVPVEVSLAQSALETGWSKNASGNMMFGIKAGKSWTGKKQLLTTTEYSKKETLNFPEILKIEKLPDGYYKYTVKDWFRAYDSPQGSFNDYGQLLSIPRYANAFNFKHDAKLFIAEIVKGGYSTSPVYLQTMLKMIESIKLGLKKNL